MKLPTPDEFVGQFETEEVFASKLPDRPITSLRDVQYVYGRLYTLATAGGGEYAAYLTPEQASDLFDDSESLIAVQVDLSGDNPTLDDETPVEITSYGRQHVESVAHCKYDAARGIDHSVTHRSGRDSSKEKLARYAKERLTKWPNDDVVQATAAGHDQGWLIETLAELGEDDAEMARIDAAIERKLGGPRTALLTVKVRTNANGDYRWPNDFEVFNEAMRARKLAKLRSKGPADDSAGEANDLVTGERAMAVGTAEDPLNYFLGKQLETFPSLDAESAWRSHPISEDVAVTIQNAEPFIEACTYSSFGATVYYLPYFLGTLTVERALQLYRILYAMIEGNGNMNPVEETYDNLGKDPQRVVDLDLRFYVAAVMKHQSKRYDVFGDSMSGNILYPVELADSHHDIRTSWAFSDRAIPGGQHAAALPTHENWDLLVENGDQLGRIAIGRYFEPTFDYPDDDQDATADDPRLRALVFVLSGEPLPVEMILEEYVDRLLSDDGEHFPTFQVASQFLQLSALAKTDLLTADRPEFEPITRSPNYSIQPMDTDTRVRADGGTKAAVRSRKLEQFIEGTPALSTDAAHGPERRGAFLLGVLVGQVGGYQQQYEDRSRTVVDQYPIKTVTAAKLKRITQEVLDKNVVYSRENDLGSTMYAEVVDRLIDAMAETDPDSWDIGTDDLRFYYSLGVSYGLNNWVSESDTEDDK